MSPAAVKAIKLKNDIDNAINQGMAEGLIKSVERHIQTYRNGYITAGELLELLGADL